MQRRCTNDDGGGHFDWKMGQVGGAYNSPPGPASTHGYLTCPDHEEFVCWHSSPKARLWPSFPYLGGYQKVTKPDRCYFSKRPSSEQCGPDVRSRQRPYWLHHLSDKSSSSVPLQCYRVHLQPGSSSDSFLSTCPCPGKQVYLPVMWTADTICMSMMSVQGGHCTNMTSEQSERRQI